MSQVFGDDELHCIRQTKIFSIADLAAFLSTSGIVSGLQPLDAASNTPPLTPPIPALPAFYVGNVNGTLYFWSVTKQTWIGLITI